MRKGDRVAPRHGLAVAEGNPNRPWSGGPPYVNGETGVVRHEAPDGWVDAAGGALRAGEAATVAHVFSQTNVQLARDPREGSPGGELLANFTAADLAPLSGVGVAWAT